MKRALILALTASCLAASAVTATAAPAKPKPVTQTFFFHGTQSFGELENSPLEEPVYPVMDATAPTGTTAKSSGITNYVAGPNGQCSGSTLFPVWVGAISGAPTGDATVELVLQTVVPGSIQVRLFTDIASQSCNEDYVPPIGSATTTLTAGQTSAKLVIKGINKKLKPFSSLMVQVSPAAALEPPFLARVQYDATNAQSKLTFSCIPTKKGAKSC